MKKIFCSALLGSALFGGNVAQVSASTVTLELIGTATSISYGKDIEGGAGAIDWIDKSINQPLVEKITFDWSGEYKEPGLLQAIFGPPKVEIYLDGKLSYTTSVDNMGFDAWITKDGRWEIDDGGFSERNNELSIWTMGPWDWEYLDVHINDPISNDPNWFSLDSWTQSHSFKLDSGKSIGFSYIFFYGQPHIQLSGTIYEAKLNPGPVPVPATVWLFGSGLVGLLGFNRKKQSLAA